MRKENSVFKTKFISEPGSFLRNADYFAFVELQDYACYCIADGIDDEKKRQSAQLAVSAVMDRFYSRSGMSKGLMKRYALAAHKELLKESHDIRLEASMLIVVTNYKKIRYVNIGNARLHHIRNNKIINQSKDQSLSQNMAEQGEIPLDMIEEHEERHNLYCYLGQPGRFAPYISPKIKLEDGDIITLCTRGIWEN
ncbi:MAG: serine/threonine protein phosphatase, partial [Bacilli bacterium]|nr:serine/threonine protein phosphatase [Bacilli bacterium]